MTPVPLAYKYVAMAVMLAEINHCAFRLQLPINLPVKESDIKVAMVFDPHVPTRVRNLPIEYGFAGRIDTEKYSFSFPAGILNQPDPGKLRFIIRLDDGYQADSLTKARGDMSLLDYQRQLAGIPSTMNTNDAYRIATNWLMAIDVDVQKLEKEHPATVEQMVPRDLGPLPIFEVYWGERGRSKVSVRIAGDTKDLLHLRQNDDSYSKRPFALIKDMDKLLAIPNEEFLKYSPMERSNLVARFAAVHYLASTNELKNLLSQTNAPPATNAPGQP